MEYTEQEKQAIEYLKKDLEKAQKNNNMFVETTDTVIEIVLNLLEKQQKEIILEKVAKEEVEELLENSISKDLIKEKIEELKTAGKTETRNNKNEVIEQSYFLQDEIDVLQELLGE